MPQSIGDPRLAAGGPKKRGLEKIANVNETRLAEGP